MKSLRIAALLLLLLPGTLADLGFDLSDALDDAEPTHAKPKEQPEAPDKPKTDGGLDLSDAFEPDVPTEKPKKPSSGDSGGFGLDLEDAFGPDPTPKPDKPAVNPPKSGGGGFGLDLEDALGPDPNPKPDKPAVNPPKSGGGGGTFTDSDLFDVSGGGYKPDGGRSGGGGGVDPGSDPHAGADQPQDPDLLWGQILKMLNANMPEEFYMWMSNLKQTVTPLLERLMDLLQAMP
ncbi:CD99 molecule isoform X2 [Pempheris klunzingeri]|uniref:CD99 molecule isoform X2 n=1 Tax=Pempheris klunzingeri TaxID=3127111 RepID=UPI0039801283